MVERLASSCVYGDDTVIIYSKWRKCKQSTLPLIGFGSQDDMKILARVASSPNLVDDLSQLDSLFETEGWQMLMTFTRESAREYQLFSL